MFFEAGVLPRTLQHVHAQHPPDKKYRDNRARNMHDPVASRFRTTEVEHGRIVARIGSARPVPGNSGVGQF